MSDEKIYNIKYEVEMGEFKKNDANGGGLWDEIVLISHLNLEDGSGSIVTVGSDGTNHLSKNRHVHHLMGAIALLSNSDDLNEDLQEFCHYIKKEYVKLMKGSRVENKT